MAALTEAQFDDLQVRLTGHGVTDLRPLPGGASSVTCMTAYSSTC